MMILYPTSVSREKTAVTVKLEVPRSLNVEQKKIISDMNDKIDEKCYKEKSMFKRILNDLFS